MNNVPRRERVQRFMGRLRPGPSVKNASIWSQEMEASSDRQDLNVDKEVEQIGRAVASTGVVTRDRLYALVGARFWGPGRFRRAMRMAKARGRIRRVRHHMYAPPSARANNTNADQQPGSPERKVGD